MRSRTDSGSRCTWWCANIVARCEHVLERDQHLLQRDLRQHSHDLRSMSSAVAWSTSRSRRSQLVDVLAPPS